MKKIFIILFFISYCAIAQVSFDGLPLIKSDTTLIVNINDRLDPFLFNVKMENIEFDERNKIYPKYFIEIFDSLKSNMSQVIIDSIKCSRYDQGIKFFDINADRYLDLALVHNATYRLSDPAYNFYLYNDSSGNFIYNEEYSDLCCAFEIDTVKNEISILSGDGLNKSTDRRYYKLLPDKPLLYKHLTTKSLEVYGIDSTVVREYGLVNGELVLIKEYYRKTENGW
jgi:hypothetical protein